MTLMRVNIDKRTNAGLTTLDVLTYAHGIPGGPDSVFIRYIATIGTSTSWFGLSAAFDATNVTIQNAGNTTSPNFEACAIKYHSIIQ